MKSPRNLIIAVVAGFFLSFFIGLISGAGIGILMLRALICAAVFGGVVFAVRLVADKFLLGDAKIETGNSSYSDEQGANVDITLDDEVFQEEPEMPQSDSFQPVPLTPESSPREKSVPVFDKANFDPSVLAEAIRTVMSKDG
jgi:hypothetical protein